MPLLARIFDDKGEIHRRRNWLRWWFAMFLVGFLCIGLCGTILAGCLWIIGGVHSLVRAIQNALMISACFGVFLATILTSITWRDQRFKREVAVRIPGHHPVIGDFEHSPFHKTWHALPILPTGASVSLWGPGLAPSDVQVALWQRFISQFESTIRSATTALMMPPEVFQGCQSVTFTPSKVGLRADGGLLIDFDFETVPESSWAMVKTDYRELWPSVIFTAELAVQEAEWNP